MAFAKLKHNPDAKAVLALFALATLLFAPMVCQHQVFYWADYALVFYPWHVFKQHCLRAGALPLWNPYLLGGMPFIGNLQSAVFYPVNLLTTFAAPPRAFLISAWIHVALAGLFQYGFLRSLRLSVIASFLGATGFMLGGFTVCRLQYPTILAVCVWTPLLCWLLEKLWQQPTLPRSALLALVFAVQLLAGHLQMSAMSVLLLLGFAVYKSFTAHCSLLTVHASPNLHRWLRLTFALCLGTLTAALQILPALGTLRQSMRAQVDYEFVSIYSLPPSQMTMFLLPASFGHPSFNNYWGEGNYYELCGYLGVLPLILAFIATFQPPNLPTFQRLRWYFVAMAGIGLLLAFGRYAPLHALSTYIPGFSSFKGPGRFLFLVAFSGSGLAALGFEAVFTAKHTSLGFCRRIVSGLAGFLTVAMFALFFFQTQLLPSVASALRSQFQRIGVQLTVGDFASVTQQFYLTISADIVRVWGLLFLLTVAMYLVRRPKGMASICLGVLLADLLPFGWRTIPTTEARFYEHAPHVVQRLQDDATPFRVLPRPNVIVRAWSSAYVSFNGFGDRSLPHLRGWLDLMSPNLNMPCGIASVEGYDPLRPARWHELLRHAQDRLNANRDDTKLLDMMNVKFVATLNAHELEGSPTWSLIERGRPLLYENHHALPRAWFVEKVRAVASWEQAKRVMDTAEFDPRRTAVVECQDATAPKDAGLAPSSKLELPRNFPYISSLEKVESPSAFLVLSEAWFPGWRAALNGKPHPMWRANGVLRGMSVPAGRHEVKMVYAPTEFRMGTFVSLLSVASLIALSLKLSCPRRAQESAR